MALAMDFRFLLDPEKKLLSIGVFWPKQQHCPNCSICSRPSAWPSLFGHAKGGMWKDTAHWFRLGRAATPIGRGVGADIFMVGQRC